MAPGVGGGGYVGIAPETTFGTYVAPTLFVPILSESFGYNEDKYFSPAIRKSVVVNDVAQNYYSIGGDIDVDVDPATWVYFMYAARHTITKTGTGPYVYTFVPSATASATTGAGATTAKSLSITVVRNGVVFKYVGCIVGGFNLRIEDGVLKSNMTMVGLSDVSTGADSPPAATFTAPTIMGAGSHQVFLDTAGSSPAFASPSLTFNTFTANINNNGAPRNRIVASRGASAIVWGEGEYSVDANFDFETRGDYDNVINATPKAVRLLSNAGASNIVDFKAFRSIYNTYPINLPGIGDVVAADANMRIVNQAGAVGPYSLEVTSPTSVT